MKSRRRFFWILGSAREPTFHRISVYQTGLLELKVTASEHRKVRDPLDVVAGRKFRKFLRVDLQDDRLACEVSRDLRNMWRGHAAGSTPFRPEINEHGNFAAAHNFVELRRIDLNGLSYRGQRCFAGAASSCVGKVIAGNSIRLSAGWAISDDGHGKVLLLDANMSE
jgi:hypothetical protein